jgi:2-octaprenyl-6-methoxyphenol hydroxylase
MESRSFEVIVVGGGPAGLTAAIALADAGVATAIVKAPQRREDNRTTALLCGSVKALDTLGIWSGCRNHAAPLRSLRIVDDTRRLVRAPELHFHADEIGLPAFGYNIENWRLGAAMEARARELRGLAVIDGHVSKIVVEAERANVFVDQQAPYSARLVIGADGRHSISRAAAGIGYECRLYDQTALTFNVGHSRPHGDSSTEFHTETGPFTLVPLPGLRSSLVFVLRTSAASRFAAEPAEEKIAEIERRSHSILGRITRIEPGWGVFPLVNAVAQPFGKGRVALIGEAAHVLPPIGAQGLNLGLRDAATIAELVTAAHHSGHDVGSGELTARYETMRRADVMSRSLAVNLLGRSLLPSLLPWQSARSLGFYLLDRIGPLRRAAMHEGVIPAASQPRLMRGESA